LQGHIGEDVKTKSPGDTNLFDNSFCALSVVCEVTPSSYNIYEHIADHLTFLLNMYSVQGSEINSGFQTLEEWLLKENKVELDQSQLYST